MTNDAEKEIFEKLNEIKQELVLLNCSVDSANKLCAHHQKWLEDHEKELGGSADITGIRTDIKELKTAQESQKWYWRAAVAGILAQAFAWIAEIFGGHK